ncbi:MAG: hypothetical protein ABIL68_08700 [bacterium]
MKNQNIRLPEGIERNKSFSFLGLSPLLTTLLLGAIIAAAIAIPLALSGGEDEASVYK